MRTDKKMVRAEALLIGLYVAELSGEGRTTTVKFTTNPSADWYGARGPAFTWVEAAAFLKGFQLALPWIDAPRATGRVADHPKQIGKAIFYNRYEQFNRF